MEVLFFDSFSFRLLRKFLSSCTGISYNFLGNFVQFFLVEILRTYPVVNLELFLVTAGGNRCAVFPVCHGDTVHINGLGDLFLCGPIQFSDLF